MSRKKHATPEVALDAAVPPEADSPVEADDVVAGAVPAGRLVRWTALGQERQAKSEHGHHAAGDEVMTEIADHLVSHGFAEDIT